MREWLKNIRNEHELTQNDVAERAGIERAYYTMIENGNRTPSVTVAKAIGKSLGFEWILFFSQDGNETKHKQPTA